MYNSKIDRHVCAKHGADYTVETFHSYKELSRNMSCAKGSGTNIAFDKAPINNRSVIAASAASDLRPV